MWFPLSRFPIKNKYTASSGLPLLPLQQKPVMLRRAGPQSGLRLISFAQFLVLREQELWGKASGQSPAQPGDCGVPLEQPRHAGFSGMPNSTRKCGNTDCGERLSKQVHTVVILLSWGNWGRHTQELIESSFTKIMPYIWGLERGSNKFRKLGGRLILSI